MTDMVFQPAHELARRIRERELSSVEAVEAFLAQIETHNPAINAIVTLAADQALERAEQADRALDRGVTWGLLHGVPITIKDCYETAGLRTVCGVPQLKDHVPGEDATVVRRLTHAGAIVLGKTNVPALAADFQTANRVFGRTGNPWNTAHTAGGSSGGSAAAVAAGMSALDVGSDLGGSIRVPAHFNGIFGLKPTEHRVSSAGHLPDADLPGITGVRGSLRHQGTYGPLARSIEDLRLALRIIEGPDPRAPDVPPVPMLQAAPVRAEKLRIAWSETLGGVAVSGDTADSLRRLAEELGRLGCDVHHAAPPDIDWNSVWETWGEITGTELGLAVPDLLRYMLRFDLARSPDRSPLKAGVKRGLRLNAKRYMRALALRDRIIGQFERFLAEWDCWLCPVTTGPAFLHQRSGRPVAVDDEPCDYLLGVAAFTTPFNMSGNPVLVLPAGTSATGLPIGVQVIASRWQDERLLAMGEIIARATPGFRPPPACRADEGS